MKVGIQTWGTEGDVRPFFALGAELIARGHDVRLVYTSVEGREFPELAAGTGVSARAVGRRYFLENEPRLRGVANEVLTAKNVFKQARLLISEMLNPVALEMLDAGLELASDSDVMVGHFMAHPAGTAALSKKCPYVSVAMAPIFETSQFTPPGAPDLGRLFNPLLWRLVAFVLESALKDSVNDLRTRCGLPMIKGILKNSLPEISGALVVMSPALLPRPADWSEKIHITGFLSMPSLAEAWTPDARVAAFLEGGEAPIFASFGSMFSLDEEMTVDAVRALSGACKLAGTRGVIQAPETVISLVEKHDGVLFITRAPHQHLFPKCSVIVHHGGAGTTQSALVARKPQIIVPHAADQSYWGATMHTLGAAPKALPRGKLTAKALAGRITEALSSEPMRARAEALGAAIATENGPRRAAEILESIARGGGR